jgi:hypothetical protein
MVVVGAGGCGEGEGPTGPSYADPCLRFKSCGECAPIRGCGWCVSPRAPGVCLHDPLECPGPQFTWTWEPNACTNPPPPPPAAGDGGASAGDTGAAASDASDGG